MVKNFSDCGFLQEGGDDFNIPATMRAALNVDLKHPLEQTRPTDAHGSRGRRHIVTSPRKVLLHTGREIVGQIFSVLFSPRKTLQDKKKLPIWYDGRR
ncbi:MAG: hypothetical protein ABL861_10795 [Nitrosomonas sp.]